MNRAMKALGVSLAAAACFAAVASADSNDGRFLRGDSQASVTNVTVTSQPLIGQGDSPASIVQVLVGAHAESDGGQKHESNRGESGRGQQVAQAIQQAIQQVAQTSIVTPNAAAPRVLEGASSTVESAQADVQSANLIAQVRASRDSTSSIQAIVEALVPQASSSSFFNRPSSTTPPLASIIQTVVQTVQNRAEGRDSALSEGTSSVGQPLPSSASSSTNLPRFGRESGTQDHQQEVQQLEQLGQSINTIVTAKKKVTEQVNQAVRTGVDATLRQALLSAASSTPESATSTAATTTIFSEENRARRLDEIRANATQQGQRIAAQISQSVVSGSIEPQQVDPVLKSSLQDIATLVSADAGVQVSVPALENRDVAQQVQTAQQDIKQGQETLAQRDGLDLYRDSDHDGISDYDEVHIYHTDPNNAYTGGGSLTDGERILLGLDPHEKSAAPVPVQDPRESGATTTALYEVSTIAYVRDASSTPASAASSTAPTPAGIAESPAASTAAAASAAPAGIRFSGRALPNSFVTVYIFSTPVVVTVKTDANGLWTYTLDQPLEDGQHQMYVATVDDSGRILAKSPAVPFTKTAEALDYQPLTIQDVSAPSPLDILRENFLVSAGVLVLIFVLIGLVTLGFLRERTPSL